LSDRPLDSEHGIASKLSSQCGTSSSFTTDWKVLADNGLLKTQDKDVAREILNICDEIGLPRMSKGRGQVIACRSRGIDNRTRLKSREEAAALLIGARATLPVHYVAYKTGIPQSRIENARVALGFTTTCNFEDDEINVIVNFAASRGQLSTQTIKDCWSFIREHPTVSPALATAAVLSQIHGIDAAASTVGVDTEALKRFNRKHSVTAEINGTLTAEQSTWNSTLKRLQSWCRDPCHGTSPNATCPTCILRSIRIPKRMRLLTDQPSA